MSVMCERCGETFGGGDHGLLGCVKYLKEELDSLCNEFNDFRNDLEQAIRKELRKELRKQQRTEDDVHALVSRANAELQDGLLALEALVKGSP